MHKLLIISIFFISFCNKIYCQTNINYPPKTYYKNAVITLKDFSKLEAKDLNIYRDSITFLNKVIFKHQSVLIEKVYYIRVLEGQKIIKWAALGGLLLGTVAVLNLINEPYVDNKGFIIAGFTGAGVLLGGLIGISIPNWKTYYINY